MKLFWEAKTDDPNYRLTTDWGALDAYHASCRYESPEHQFVGLPVDTWTPDAAASPRNSAWFLCALGARRALTFLERQPEADGERLGVYGHSMGGKITVLTAAADWRATCAAHHNHQDTAAHEVATQLWMDQHLKRAFSFPRTPEADLDLNSGEGVPSFVVRPDTSRAVLSVDVYYTQQGEAAVTDRFWHHAVPTKQGDAWGAPVPVLSTARPLWFYADVLYSLETPVSGAGLGELPGGLGLPPCGLGARPAAAGEDDRVTHRER